MEIVQFCIWFVMILNTAGSASKSALFAYFKSYYINKKIVRFFLIFFCSVVYVDFFTYLWRISELRGSQKNRQLPFDRCILADTRESDYSKNCPSRESE
ncbi:hypothetical protein PUN28_015589 [Cardiocondyla obscurior]|uniref:Uncharacterized protein n=1 Tax=Cardiocondyla obscurior TaxID=286306 RepID=A0AAW2EZ47_9HYME